MNKKVLMLITTSISGNTLEWYDFALYGYFASVLAKLFFPVEDNFFSLILTFSVFASGFIVRPLGGAIFGHIGDRYGRRAALIFSISLATIATVFIGLLPTYHTIGMLAPVLLTILRLLQGLAVSGELTGSSVFLIECAPSKNRGFLGSLAMCSTYVGLLLGSGVGLLITTIFNLEQILSFFWRVPFLISFIFGTFIFLLRLRSQESTLFVELNKKNNLLKFPVKECVKKHSLRIILTCLTNSSLASGIYLIIGYFPTFFGSMKGLNLKQTMMISFVGLLALTLLVFFVGILSKVVSKRKILGFGAFGTILFSCLIFNIANQGGITKAIIAELMLIVFLASLAGSAIAFLFEVFPDNLRYTGISIGYNISMTIFGGTTPLIAIYLTRIFKTNLAPSYYLMFCGIITLIGVLILSKNFSEKTLLKDMKIHSSA